MKKIKLFLGAYINYPNAQNVNCDNIAKYLDKDKFEVHTMYTSRMPVNKQLYKKKGIHLHKLIHHRFIWYWCKYLTMLFGGYDIYYLPKMEPMDIVFARRHKKKLFISSVEGVITDSTNNTERFRNYYTELMDDFFAISNCIAESIRKYWKLQASVLPLGIVKNEHIIETKQEIKRVVWAGNIKSNKRPQFLVECAKRFPHLSFCMIGDGDMLDSLIERCRKENINNITFTGRIPNSDVYLYMAKGDLFLMTSEYEGLPKVIQEAAQSKLPTIYINENYKVDFIEDGMNGFAVSDLDSMIGKIQYLLDHPDKYREMSEKAYQTIQDYTWEKLINKYEEYFIEQYHRFSEAVAK